MAQSQGPSGRTAGTVVLVGVAVIVAIATVLILVVVLTTVTTPVVLVIVPAMAMVVPQNVLRRGRGKSPRNLQLIDAAHQILAEIQPASVRAVCYRLFALGLITSMARCETKPGQGATDLGA